MNVAEVLALFFTIDAVVFCDNWNSWFGSEIKPDSEARDVFGKVGRITMMALFVILLICEWCPYMRQRLFGVYGVISYKTTPKATVDDSLGSDLKCPLDAIQVRWMLNHAKQHNLKEYELDGFVVCYDDKGVWYYRYEGANWQKYSTGIAKQLRPNPEHVEAKYELIKDELREAKIVIDRDMVFTDFTVQHMQNSKNESIFYSLRGPHIRSRGPEPKPEYAAGLEALYFQAMQNPNNSADADGFTVYLDKHHNWVHTIPDFAIQPTHPLHCE